MLPSFHVNLYARFDEFFPARCKKSVESSKRVDALDFLEKLAGGTGTFIRVRGQPGLEVGLDLFRVLGGSGRSIMRRHLRRMREHAYIVSGLYTN